MVPLPVNRASHHDHRADSGAERGQRDQVATEAQPHIVAGVLHGVAGFVCRHGDGGHRGLAVVGRRQAQDVLLRIVVIGQTPSHGLDPNVGDSVLGQDRRRGLRAGDAMGVWDPAPLGVRCRPTTV